MVDKSVLFRMKTWKWLLLLVFSMVGTLILYGVSCIFPMEVKNVYALGVLSLSACAVMCGIYAMVSRNVENREVTELKMRRFAPDFTVGCVIGGASMALSILGMRLAGVYHGVAITPNWEGIVQHLFLLLIVAVGEELAFRAVLLRMIEERWGTTVALVISCLAFGFVHYTNDGGTVWSSIAIAITAVEATSFIYSRSLWMPIGSHFAWNFVQGNVFGFAVSGNVFDASLLKAELSGSPLLTGGDFGPEASIITVVLTTAVAALLLILAIRKGNFIPFRNPLTRAK